MQAMPDDELKFNGFYEEEDTITATSSTAAPVLVIITAQIPLAFQIPPALQIPSEMVLEIRTSFVSFQLLAQEW
jgi:hypothetical protein